MTEIEKPTESDPAWSLERLTLERAALLEAAGHGICGIDGHGRITFLNAAAARMCGYTRDELLGKPIHDTLHHSRRDGSLYPRDECPLSETLRSGAVHRVDREVFWRKDGTALAVDYVSAPIRDGERLVGAVVTFHDITEREQAAERLRRLNRALGVITQCNGVLVRATDERELLDAVCRLLVERGGYRLAWVGFAERDEPRTIRAVAHAGVGEEYVRGLRLTWADTELGRGPSGTSIRTGGPIVVRDILTDPRHAPWRGEALRHGYASTAALPLREGAGAFGTLRVYSRVPDAFDDEELELLQQLADDLAFGITAVRTRLDRARAETQVRQSERLAALGRLAAGVGHELKNPLAVIAMRVQMLRMNMAEGKLPASETLSRHLASLEEACGRMLRIMQGLSTYAKPSRTEPMPLDMGDLLAATAELVAYDARNRRVAIAVETPPALPPVLGDRSQLMQVLVNLATNALEAMTSGGRLTLRARAGERSASGGTGRAESSLPAAVVVVEIEDTGPGIPAAVLGRIWEPFFTTKTEGTGLGLSIVRGIVADHPGATLDVDTRVGRGTTFILRMPATIAAG